MEKSRIGMILGLLLVGCSWLTGVSRNEQIDPEVRSTPMSCQQLCRSTPTPDGTYDDGYVVGPHECRCFGNGESRTLSWK